MSALVVELRSLISLRSDLTQSQAAEILQVSRARVSQLAKENNLLFRDGRAAYRHRPRTPHASQRPAPSNPLPASSSPGMDDEDACAVAADLLQRNFVVYRAMTQASAFELVGDRDGKLLRIKVCHAGEPASGHAADPARCDILAIVDSDGSIVYRAASGIELDARIEGEAPPCDPR